MESGFEFPIIGDVSLNKTTTCNYDLGGKRIRERTAQGGVVYQDNQLAFDAQAYLRSVMDTRASLLMDYDAAGNRSRIRTHVINNDGSWHDTDRYFQYDAMNRQTVVDGIDAAGNITQGQGHKLTYDQAGNRLSDTYWGNQVTSQQVIDHYETRNGQLIGQSDSGDPIYETINVPVYRTDYSASAAVVTDQYQYDTQNRLSRTTRDGTVLDVRTYDAAGRVIVSGPAQGLSTGWVSALNQGVSPSLTQATEIRINRWNAAGRLSKQFVRKSDGAAKYNVLYDTYDAAGNLINYRVQNFDGTAYTANYNNTIGRFDSYRQTATNGNGDRFYGGSNEQQYDASGNLIGIRDVTLSANNRSFINDADGRALYVNQGGYVMRQLIANGEVIARFGSGVDPANPRDGNGNPNFTHKIADFNFGYQPINGSYPAPAPGTYTVRPGDTLDSIARGAFGDGKLWYSIADANGIDSNSDLKVGQTLTIPSRVAAMSNSAQTFTPYNAAKVMGDTSPNLPQPQSSGGGGGGCGGLGRIIVAVVAIVATVMTAGALINASAAAISGTAASTGLGAAWSTGAAAFAAGEIGVGTAAIAAAAGSIAGQTVGVATGIQDGFSWKQVALSVVSGSVTAGVGQALAGNDFFKVITVESAAAKAAIVSTLTQGIGVATGLQKSFDWRGAVAAAVGAGVGASETLSNTLNTALPGSELAMKIARGTAAGIVSGTAAALMRGGRVGVQAVATDAFANALGNSIAEAAQPAAPQSDLGNGLRVTQEVADSWGNRTIPDAPVARMRLDSLIADGERVTLSANDVKTDLEKLTELFYPKDGARAGFSEGLPLLAAGPGYSGGLPTMPSPEKTRSLVNDALNVKQMRSKSFDEQRDTLDQLINARRSLGNEVDVDSRFAKGQMSLEEYRENINQRNALGQGIRMQYSNAKTTGAIDPGLYPEEMQGWGGAGINFGRGLRSMGSRFERSSWEVDGPGSSSNSGLFSNKYPSHEIGNPLQVLTPSQVANQSFSRRLNYVVLEDGTLVMGRQKRDVIGGGHIDLAGGKDVLAAGEVKFVDGQIRYIDNSSGHYLPSGRAAQDAALKAFQDAGLGGRGLYVEKYWDTNRRAWVPK